MTLRFHDNGEGHVRVRVPKEALRGWSLSTPLPALNATERDDALDVYGLSYGDQTITLPLRGPVVSVALWSVYSSKSDALREASERLGTEILPLYVIVRGSVLTL